MKQLTPHRVRRLSVMLNKKNVSRTSFTPKRKRSFNAAQPKAYRFGSVCCGAPARAVPVARTCPAPQTSVRSWLPCSLPWIHCSSGRGSCQYILWDGISSWAGKMAMLRAKAIVRSLQAIGLDQAFINCGLKDLGKSHAGGDWHWVV